LGALIAVSGVAYTLKEFECALVIVSVLDRFQYEFESSVTVSVATIIVKQPVWHVVVLDAMEIVGVVGQQGSWLGRYSVAVFSMAQSGTAPQRWDDVLLGVSGVRVSWYFLKGGKREARIHTWGNVGSEDCMGVAEVRNCEDTLHSDDV
jgi:hypothetical protein